MHELYIAESIHRLASEQAAAAGATRIIRLDLEVGALSGVVVESLEFCFPAVAKGGPAEGAELVIERVPGKAQCGACGQDYDVGSYLDPCPSCEVRAPQVTSGQQLELRSIEVE